jgi:DNA-binding response OmpR family regulator
MPLLWKCVLTMPCIQETEPLQGLRVLVVEDETLVAMLIEDYLTEFGCEVACCAARVSKGLQSLKCLEIDAAVLDVNVAGESVSPIAEVLDQRNIPFIFASGYGTRGLEPRWAGRPVLQKPFSAVELRLALLACVRPAS